MIVAPMLVAVQLSREVSPTLTGDMVNEPSLRSDDKLYVSVKT